MAAKMAPFAATEPGISTLDTFLPQALELVERGILTLPELIERLTLGPAKAADIKAGSLGVGDVADICIFDPQQRWRVAPDTLVSNGHNTPLMNCEVQGRVTHTLLAGRRVFPARG
jgi:dihydroorotase